MANNSKIIENIFNSIITGIVSFFLPLIISFIYSVVIGWNFKVSIFTVMCNIPIYIYLILLIPFCFWIIRKYAKRKMNEGVHLVGFSSIHNYENVDQIEYNNLIWIIQVNSHSLRHSQFYWNINEYKSFQEILTNINVKSTPRCPKCGAELYYSEHDLWHEYECVNCSFKKRTWKSRDKMIDIAKKLYKYKLECEFNEKYGE